jgi:hypothetical protein
LAQICPIQKYVTRVLHFAFRQKGAMVTAPGLVDERYIFYKHADANFFSAFPFVLGKAVSQIPQVRWKGPKRNFTSFSILWWALSCGQTQ